MFNLNFDWDWNLSDEELKKIDEVLSPQPPPKRSDYCYDCGTDKLYTHAMTFKCSICHSIILGGTK